MKQSKRKKYVEICLYSNPINMQTEITFKDQNSLQKHRHMCDIDVCDDTTYYPRFRKRTYQQVIVGDLEPKVEIREYKDEPSGLLITDLSLRSIIASGNTELLRPVGPISDTLLMANDNVNYIADRIDNFAENNIVEQQNITE